MMRRWIRSLPERCPLACPTESSTFCWAETRAAGFPWRGSERLRSEEHTSELQSQFHLVCRLLLEKKKIKNKQSKILNIARYVAEQGNNSPAAPADCYPHTVHTLSMTASTTYYI